VDSSKSFDWYKPVGLEWLDITRHYFEPEHREIILQTELPLDFHHRHQWKDYAELNYVQLVQLIRRYFVPTVEIANLVLEIESRYQIVDYDNICVLFYRGNDKAIETQLCGYDEFIEKAREVQAENPGIRFLIQSDETEFIHRMSSEFPDSFYLKYDIRHMSKRISSVDLTLPQFNYEFSKRYLAITVLMGKCKHIICNTGNCSLWIMLFRGHAENVHQHFCGGWVRVREPMVPRTPPFDYDSSK
jgi:hypothetical protein